MSQATDCLSILQYNCMKSKDIVMATLLRDTKIYRHSIIAIQEPWINPFASTTHNPIRDRFELLYPEATVTEEADATARVCFFVNKEIGATEWTYTQHSLDLITLHLKYKTSEDSRMRIVNVHNVYNSGPSLNVRGTQTLAKLKEALRAQGEHIVVGDFNLHHPMWAGENYHHQHAEADELIEIIEEHSLQLLLPPGTITYRARAAESTLDLTFVSQGLESTQQMCQVASEMDNDSDHLPVRTVLDLNLTPKEVRQSRLWDKMDEALLLRMLRSELSIPHYPDSKDEIDHTTTLISKALQKAIEAAVPLSRGCSRSVTGWNQECKDVQMECKRLRRRFMMTQELNDWDEYKRTRNRKKRIHQKALKTQHREKIEEATASTKGLWQLARWAKNRTSQYRGFTPNIQGPEGLITASEGKARIFKETFFPTPPEADLTDLEGYLYPPSVEWNSIQSHEIVNAIKRAASNKAPGTDGTPNRVLKIALPVILPLLLPLYNACWTLGYHPKLFRESKTAVLRKPAKGDYTQPKAYRPIALLNTLGKALESVMATRISFAAEEFDRLPRRHMGGRKARGTEHALQVLLELIHAAWLRGEVATVLLLDVMGAFDNLSHMRLIHNLKKRRIGGNMINWILSFLSNRSTIISLPEYISKAFETSTGIPQGSPISPLLYLFYNADLMEEEEDFKVTNLGYIDDIAKIVTGPSAEVNCRKIEGLFEAKEHSWSKKHASKFAPTKFQLLHFKRSTKKRSSPEDDTLHLDDYTIEPQNTGTYLGVLLDKELKWIPHLRRVEKGASQALNALNSLGGSVWGASSLSMRRVYQACVIPKALYACSLWYSPEGGFGTVGLENAIIKTLNSVQRRAARAIAGAFRNTSGPALDVELYLLPIKLVLEKALGEALIRLRTSQVYDQIKEARQHSRATEGNFRLWSPLRKLEERYDAQDRLDLETLESIEQIRPWVAPPWRMPTKYRIAEDKDIALKEHDEIVKNPELFIVYTDGSAINGKVGAAAVVPNLGIERNLLVGNDTRATVYAAELHGLMLATSIASQHLGHKTSLIIFTDNQAAITSSSEPGTQSGQGILRVLAITLDRLRWRGIEVRVHWIPAHIGVPGNEMADRSAKQATGWRENPWSPSIPPTINISFSAMRSSIKMRLRKRVYSDWEAQWRGEKVGSITQKLIEVPTKAALRLHVGLHRALSSALIQLRTGKIGLRDYLHSIKRADSGECLCGWGRQTIKHVLTECPIYQRTRLNTIWKESRVQDLKQILSTPKLAKEAARFVIWTRLLGQFGSVSMERLKD